MKLFTLLQTRYDELDRAVKTHLSKTLNEHGVAYSNSSVFGQMMNVMNSVAQNILLYVEDALTEQNKYTAQRKKSIYGLAAQSGYEPSLGKAATCNIKLTFIPNNEMNTDIIIPNKTKLLCSQNNLIYNIVLPQEAITLSLNHDSTYRYLQIVEGSYETQRFISNGGKLYTINVPFTGDMDIDFLEVKVNDKKWERVSSLYDADVDGEQFVAKTGLNGGIDLIFGNDQFGRALKEYDSVEVTYLLHSGEDGNINPLEECIFTFEDEIYNTIGEGVNVNEVFRLTLTDEAPISGGTYSESTQQVKEMIGFNSRALVLANANNYRNLINKFSFCGYNRTWSEPGSLVINSIILKKYKNLIKDGKDYFNLKKEDMLLSPQQRDSIQTFIRNSGQQLVGVTYNIFDPEICKYACYVYLKMKNVSYDRSSVEEQIRNIIGNYMADNNTELFIPKSSFVQLIKNSIDSIDSVDIYFLSERNEQAIKEKRYVKNEMTYNPATGTYDSTQELITLHDDEDPGLGLDEHGNIQLTNRNQFPVLMGGWNFKSSDEFAYNDEQYTTITDPLIITFR